MSKDGQTPADHSFLTQPFVWGTRLILAYPVATIALALGFALVALALSWTRLGYRTSRLDLINPKSDYNRLWLEYIKEFGEEDDAVIVVEGAGREQVVPVLEELSAALAREDRLFHAVLHEVDLSKIRAKGLHYLEAEQLAAIDGFLAEAQPIVAGDWSRLSIGKLATGMMMRMQAAMQTGAQMPPGMTPPPGMQLPPGTQFPPGMALPAGTQLPPGSQLPSGSQIPPGMAPPGAQMPAGQIPPGAQMPAGQVSLGATQPPGGAQPPMGQIALAGQIAQTGSIDELERMTGSLLSTLSQRGGYQSPFPEMPRSFALLSELSSDYLLDKDGQLGFVLLRLATGDGDNGFTGGSEATDALRALIAQVQTRHRNVKIGLTGLPIMESDEMRTSQSSMFWSSFISMIGVGLLFIAGFGGIRHALLANVILLVGMAWAFGYATLSVGHLNILSVTFTVTLIGIGIDYGVYYVARYLQLRGENQDCEAAIMATSRGAGPAITAGALTTAVSFFCAGLTSFTGVAELGIIAGGGILLCAVAELTLLPAAISLMDRSGWGVKMPKPLAVHKWIEPFIKVPRLTLGVTLIITVVLSVGLSRLWFDNNLLNMQAVGLESVELERKLLSECNKSVWYALSICDSREELLARKKKFEQLATVEKTDEIASFLSADDELKRPIIERIGQRLAALPERPPLIPIDRPEKLGEVLGQMQVLIARSGRADKCARQLDQIRQLMRSMPLYDCYRLVSLFQQQMAGDLLSRLHVLRSLANPEPPQLSDLPDSLVHRFVGQHGRYLLKIYGKGNIWDAAALGQFVKDVRSVDPQVTGNPLQAHEASFEMKRSYQEAAIYSLLVIIGVLVLDFRSLRYSLIAATPLAVGMLQTYGLLGYLNVPLNPANLIALPLILGIGVDYGVHIVHEFREQSGPYRMSPGTAVAVLVDGLTTIVGFGSLMIASHQGLQSLGRVLTIAVTCCMFSSLVMLPALLTLMTRHRRPAEPAEFEPASEPATPAAIEPQPIARAA